MSHLNIVITGCSDKDFERFTARADIAGMGCRKQKDGLLCTVPADMLEPVFVKMQTEATKSWQDPKRQDTLAFDSAFFPNSSDVMQPVRQLRGLVAARLAHKKANLPPAYASPAIVFGGKDEK